MSYFKRIPLFFWRSLKENKDLIEIEQDYKFLKRDVTIKNEFGRYNCGRNIMSVYPLARAYENHFLSFFELKNGVFLDIGAHLGKYSIMLANRLGENGKVISLEPEEQNFKLLSKNVELNELSNMHCINIGAFSKKDEMTFYLTQEGEMYHSLYKSENTGGKVKISVDTVDNILKKLQVDKVDLIKIDTEGAELEVVKGALNTIKESRPSIIVEVWSGEHLSQISEILHDFGYHSPAQIDDENYFYKRPFEESFD